MRSSGAEIDEPGPGVLLGACVGVGAVLDGTRRAGTGAGLAEGVVVGVCDGVDAGVAEAAGLCGAGRLGATVTFESCKKKKKVFTEKKRRERER